MNYENEPMLREQSGQTPAQENMFLGMIGALVGAVIGGASIILLGRLGYVASISGVFLAICTLKGYELLARGLSRGGVIFCTILMLLTPFVVDWIDWAMLLMEYGLTFWEGMVMFPELLVSGGVEMSVYLKNLGMIYLFVILGGFYTVKDALKRKQAKA